jgi:hypothetical protein
MSKTFFLEPSWIGTGLTNEIYFIIYGLIYCINNNKNLIINNFRLEPMSQKFCEISDILDIHHLNVLMKKFDITIFDKNKLSFNIDNISYGLNNKIIDITDEILKNYFTNNRLFIPIGTVLNNIKGDPFPGEQKKLIINYRINELLISEEYSEYIYQDIVIDLQNPTNILNWTQIDDCYTNNKELFEYLLKNIKFNNRFIKYSENALLIDSNNEYNHLPIINFENKKINVIHLRVEKDMTGHMLTHNKMTQEEYDMELQNKYIELIKKYFSKNDIIFVLSYDLNNNVIKFLKDNNYEFYVTKKNIFDGRERHAIVDLLIGEKCNNYFIGNWNFDISQGSTFSYFLYIRNNVIKNIFIDMYNIKSDEKIVDKFLILEDNYLFKKNYDYITKKYNILCNRPLDINEHLPTLYKYAKECNSVIECGVRGCVSSWAFVLGLIDNKNNTPKKIMLNDIEVCDIDDLLMNTKNINNLQVEYKWCSDLDLEVAENVDLVFIDTLHVYGQLKRELEKFSKISNKYIIMHDTTVDEIYGECIRLNWNIENMSKITNFTPDELTKGLKPALNEFLFENNEWVIHEIFVNNNGLTILKKIENHNKKLLPISFSIPEEKICNNIDISVKTKIEALVKPLIDRLDPYKYDKEEDYYNDLKTSFFAYTCKRNGWDTMRHYEILANNCIPYFSDLNECPKNILCFFPKELIKESNKLYEKVKNLNIEDFVTNYEYINKYTELLQKLMIHTKKYLTTASLANYILDTTNNKPLNILFLSPNQNVDYLKSLTLHGFKKIFGNKCHDYPKIPHIYKSCNSISLYGNGFTYSKLLDDNYRDDSLDNTIEEDLKNKKYDMIIYSQASIHHKFYDIISEKYEPSKVIFLNGEDHVTHFHLKDFNDKISKGHFCYIREFHDFNKYDYFIPFINYFARF